MASLTPPTSVTSDPLSTLANTQDRASHASEMVIRKIEELVATLTIEEASSVVANPFSERSRSLLKDLPSPEVMIGGVSLYRGIQSALGVESEPITHTPELHTRWADFTDRLINGGINPLTLSPVRYLQELRMATGIPVGAEERLGQPFDLFVSKLLEVRGKMLGLCEEIGIAPPPESTLSLAEHKEAFQKICHPWFTLPTTGTVQLTPLGLILYLPMEESVLNQMGDAGGKHCGGGLSDASWNGLINVIPTQNHLVPNEMDCLTRDVREHELRHGLQKLVNPILLTDRFFWRDFRDAVRAREGGDSTAFNGLQEDWHLDAARYLRRASEELACYRSGGQPFDKPLERAQFKFENVEQTLEFLENTLRRSHISPRESEEVLSTYRRIFGEVYDTVMLWSATAAQAEVMGIPSASIRSAIEISGMDTLSSSLSCYGISFEDPAEWIHHRTAAENSLWEVTFDVLVPFVKSLDTPSNLVDPHSWSSVYESVAKVVRESPHVRSALERDLKVKENGLARSLLFAKQPDDVIPTAPELIGLFETFGEVVTSGWVMALPTESAEIRFFGVPGFIEKLKAELCLQPQGTFSDEALDKQEVGLIVEWLRPKNDKTFPFENTLNELVRALHRHRFQESDERFGLESYSSRFDPFIIRMVWLGGSPSLNTTRDVALRADFFSRFWSWITPDHIRQLQSPEDFGALLMIAQHWPTPELSLTAVQVGEGVIERLPSNMQELARARLARSKRFTNFVVMARSATNESEGQPSDR